jgi:hypothetical protein
MVRKCTFFSLGHLSPNEAANAAKNLLFKKNTRRFPKEAPDILIFISIET